MGRYSNLREWELDQVTSLNLPPHMEWSRWHRESESTVRKNFQMKIKWDIGDTRTSGKAFLRCGQLE
jgi:outer membrane usher protein FimD/PapC